MTLNHDVSAICDSVCPDADDPCRFSAQLRYQPGPGKQGFVIGRGLTPDAAIEDACRLVREALAEGGQQ